MANDVLVYLNKLISHLNNLDKTRIKMEALLKSGVIVRRDIEQVYEGLFMGSITSLENWIENLFIGLMVGRIKHPSSLVVPRVSFNSDRIAREVTFGGRSYLDWLPYEKYTKKRAKAFFRNGVPFTNLDNKDIKKLNILYTVRNAIAHKSPHSLSLFQKEIIGSNPVSQQERNPAGYLRSIFRISPSQTRYENFITEMVLTVKKLCS
ncbi:MAG: hypothetical protein NT096_07160 [Proteobacteria bacterium]|nr:hypothetical protein [Pseudomonadota bacterium]